MTIHILSKHETQEILEKLKDQFGIDEIPGILLRIGQERLFLYQGSLNEKEIKKLEETVPVERLGVYIGKLQDDGIRLSIEGTHIFKNQITKNIFELEENQVEPWMKGNEILLDDYNVKNKIANEDSMLTSKNKSVSDSKPISGWGGGDKSVRLKPNKGFVIMKYKNDFLGTGKASENKITNFIPKNRRLREKS